MTEDDIDRWLSIAKLGPGKAIMIQSDKLADLCRLARRGLSVEREVCGTCCHARNAHPYGHAGGGRYCEHDLGLLGIVWDDDSCSRWRAKEGVE